MFIINIFLYIIWVIIFTVYSIYIFIWSAMDGDEVAFNKHTNKLGSKIEGQIKKYGEKIGKKYEEDK